MEFRCFLCDHVFQVCLKCFLLEHIPCECSSFFIVFLSGKLYLQTMGLHIIVVRQRVRRKTVHSKEVGSFCFVENQFGVDFSLTLNSYRNYILSISASSGLIALLSTGSKQTASALPPPAPRCPDFVSMGGLWYVEKQQGGQGGRHTSCFCKSGV